MYSTGTETVAATRAADHFADRKYRAYRDRTQKADSGPERERNAFLKQRLHPIAPVSVTRDDFHDGCNYITRGNYEYLLASARRYASLLGRELGHDPGLSPGEGIANLYRELDKIIGDVAYLNIEPEDERLVFVLWSVYQWGGYDFYWVPVRFVEKLNPRLRRVAISFLHQFCRSNGMGTTNDTYDFEMMTMWYEERALDKNEEEPGELARLAQLYSVTGRVGKLMKRIETKNYCKRLGPALDRYVPQSDYETELVGLMKRGLQFIGKDKPAIMSYAYNPFRDQKNEDDYVVGPDRMIMLTYDVDSDFESETRSYIGEEINNGYEVCPCATLTLRPDGNDVFGMEDYPTDFYKYLDELVHFLRMTQ
jgi:hypothetical protein